MPAPWDALGVSTDVWDQAGSYRTSGVLTAFLRNFQFMEVEEPSNTSPDYIQELMETVSVDPEPLTTVERPNIIAIMNESWADYENFGTVQFSESLTDRIDASGALLGHAYTSVFGAGTSASEFEFLTGNSMAFLPSGKYTPISSIWARAANPLPAHPVRLWVRLSCHAPRRAHLLAAESGLSQTGL